MVNGTPYKEFTRLADQYRKCEEHIAMARAHGATLEVEILKQLQYVILKKLPQRQHKYVSGYAEVMALPVAQACERAMSLCQVKAPGETELFLAKSLVAEFLKAIGQSRGELEYGRLLRTI